MPVCEGSRAGLCFLDFLQNIESDPSSVFDSLSERLGGIFDRLTGRGALSEEQVGEALREVRLALLEADVSLPVVKDFIETVRVRAVGQDVLRSVAPGQQVVKIVHDVLVETLSPNAGETAALNLTGNPPTILLLAGLQGAGKTTTAAKLGLFLQTKQRKKVLLAGLDVYRPAAQAQLATLGEQYSIATLPIIEGQMPLDIAKRALESARLGGYDAVIWDTAGRQNLDEAMMAELANIHALGQKLSLSGGHALETLLVADSMTGQEAVKIAEGFMAKVAITGVILTRVDGDARGGAALSMRAATNAPIKFLGMGEKADALEVFHADRIASRILGMGDVVSLVEKAAETIDRAEAAKMAAKMKKGSFDLDDYAEQLQQMRKMGGLQAILGMLPGMGAIKNMASAGIDDKTILRQSAIISSMTKAERRNITILNASRRRRIAAGSGTDVQDINRLIKQFQDMQTMMKRMQNGGLAGMMRQLGGGKMGGMGGMPKAGSMPANLDDLPPEMRRMLEAEGGMPDMSDLMGGGLPTSTGHGLTKFQKFKKKVRRK